MFSCSQVLSALNELRMYKSPDVAKLPVISGHYRDMENPPNYYRFSFDFCGNRLTAYFNEAGEMLGCVDQRNGVKRKVHETIVEGALELAVKTTCLENVMEKTA